VEILYNKIFNFINTFIDNYVLPEFQVRYKKLIRQYRDDMIMIINTSIKKGLNRLLNSIERYDGNTSDIFQRFFKYLGNPLAYDI
jgi:hypothetical protein